MAILSVSQVDLDRFRERFGERLQTQAPLARYTAARLGGPAEALLEVFSADELAQAVELAWETDCGYTLLGGGSNVLISDRGISGLVILNRARAVKFEVAAEPPVIWAESGANLGVLARQAAAHGLSGLEWAAGIPGTLGGAVVGNAGAHGGDMGGNLLLANILQPDGKRLNWPVEKLEYGYRSSALRRMDPPAVVLAARLHLEHDRSEEVQKRLEEFVAYRKLTQPPGASLGSMFKNPSDDYAGRLIEAAGLKGARIGDVQISPVHANFFINIGNARAQDYYKLILLAQETVAREFGVRLKLEIVLLGEW